MAICNLLCEKEKGTPFNPQPATAIISMMVARSRDRFITASAPLGGCDWPITLSLRRGKGNQAERQHQHYTTHRDCSRGREIKNRTS